MCDMFLFINSLSNILVVAFNNQHNFGIVISMTTIMRYNNLDAIWKKIIDTANGIAFGCFYS